MDAAHTIWTQALGWLVPPLRLSLFLFLVLLLLVKALPALLRIAGRVTQVTATPAALLLTYPEYLATSLSRRLGWRLAPGTFAYNQFLGALAAGVSALGTWLHAMGQHWPSFPRKTFVLLSAIAIAAWYTKVENMPELVRNTVTPAQAELVRVDTWLGTGEWAPAGNAKAAWCTPVKAGNPAKPKGKPRKK
jgi:hypothetical protein